MRKIYLKKPWRNMLIRALPVVVAVVVTAGFIYFTPLRHVTLLSPAMHSVEPQEFYEDFSAHPDDYILIDVRSANVFQSAHAKGAVSIPVENLYDDHFRLPRTDKKIALICTTGRLAAIGYGYLENWGFRNLIHIQGGMVAWTAAGLPVEGNNILAPAPLDEHQ